jgi:hypothetical protein
MSFYRNNKTKALCRLYLCKPPKILGQHYEEVCFFTGKVFIIKNFKLSDYTLISQL